MGDIEAPLEDKVRFIRSLLKTNTVSEVLNMGSFLILPHDSYETHKRKIAEDALLIVVSKIHGGYKDKEIVEHIRDLLDTVMPSRYLA